MSTQNKWIRKRRTFTLQCYIGEAIMQVGCIIPRHSFLFLLQLFVSLFHDVFSVMSSCYVVLESADSFTLDA